MWTCRSVTGPCVCTMTGSVNSSCWLDQACFFILNAFGADSFR